MAATTTSGADADRNFEERWRRAQEQPEVVEVNAKKIELDLTPAAILNRLRDIAEVSREQGELDEEAYKAVIQGSREIERALGRLAPERFRHHLDKLKSRLRDKVGQGQR